jgi:hypothetical protein
MGVDKKRRARSQRSAVPSNQVHLPGTVGATRPERAIALIEQWAEEGAVGEDRAAARAVRDAIERARS